MNDDDILIRYAYSYVSEPKIDSDPTDFINGELTYNSGPYENIQEIDGVNYKISLHKCTYKLDSENVSKKSMTVNNYLHHYDEVGPIRGWIHLNIDSKYIKDKGKWKLNQLNCTNNVITAFGDPRYSQAFIFTKYKNIVNSLQHQTIEKISANLETTIKYKPNVLQIGNFGSLITKPDKVNNCEVNFIGKIEFPVFELRIFDLYNNPINDQKIYDFFIKDFYNNTNKKRDREYSNDSSSTRSHRAKGKNKKKQRTRTKPKLKKQSHMGRSPHKQKKHKTRVKPKDKK